MTAQEARNIPALAIFALFGIEPQRINQREAWFIAAWRGERTASVKVDLFKNLWYDHGEGRGGNALDLYILLSGIRSVREALHALAGGVAPPLSFSPAASQIVHGATAERLQPELKKFAPLQNSALIEYAAGRGIAPELAALHLKEVYWRVGGKYFFGLGIANRAGGFDVRNKYFKGCVGSKDLTIIPGREALLGEAVNIFEGFFDFISALQYFNMQNFKNDTIILNSISMTESAAEYININGYKIAYLFVDNDKAGNKAKERLETLCKNTNIEDKRSYFMGFKDFNEKILAK